MKKILLFIASFCFLVLANLGDSDLGDIILGYDDPTATTIVYPLDGDTVVSSTPTIRWANMAPLDTAYILELSIDTFKTSLSLDTIVGPDTVKAKVLSDSVDWYSARVKSGNPGGWSAWGAVVSFRTVKAGGGGYSGYVVFGTFALFSLGAMGMGARSLLIRKTSKRT